MKRLILLIALLLPFYAMAAAPITTKLLDKYGNDEGVTVVNLEGAMLQAMIASELENTEDAADVAKYLDAIRIITCEEHGLSAKIRKDIDKLIKKLKLQSLIDMPSEGVKIFTHNEGDVATSIIVYVIDDESVVLVDISGKFTPDILNEIVESL